MGLDEALGRKYNRSHFKSSQPGPSQCCVMKLQGRIDLNQSLNVSLRNRRGSFA